MEELGWVIFGVASFTALVVSWTVFLLISSALSKASKMQGFSCPHCGAVFGIKPTDNIEKGKIGFRKTV